MNNNVIPASNYIPGLGEEFYITADELDPSIPLGNGSYLQANKVSFQAQSTATDVPTLVSNFNTLLTNMIASGVMAAQ